MFDSFIADYARREKHRTAETYRKLLGQFERWLAERGLDVFDRDDVLEFLEEPKRYGKTWSNASRNIFLAALRGWAKDARAGLPSGTTLVEIQKARDDEKRLERITGIRGYAGRREEKPALSLEQISILFDAMDPDTSSLFWVLLWFGLRVGELKLIKNVDWEAGRLAVETEKVGGTRALFFDGYTARLLRHAFDRGLPDLSDIKIWKLFRRYSGYCAPAKLTPHLCRHTFATRFAERTDRDTLRRMLGHGARETTDIYIHPGEERIREAMVEHHYLKPLEPEEAASDGF